MHSLQALVQIHRRSQEFLLGVGLRMAPHLSGPTVRCHRHRNPHPEKDTPSL